MRKDLPNPTNKNVIILTGDFGGVEGVCLGENNDGLWAVSPHGSDRILMLRFDEDFGILINKGQPPGPN